MKPFVFDDAGKMFLRMHLKRSQRKGYATKVLTNMLLQIINTHFNKHQFMNYSFKEDIKQSAIVECLRAIPNFKLDKSENVVAYFIVVAQSAAIRLITSENKQREIQIKYKERWEFDQL